jgi:hypothetical protein
MRLSPIKAVSVICLVFILTACASITPFSQRAYEQAVSLKVESLALMDKATAPYNQHQQQADTLKLNLEKAFEYAKGLPKNEETTRQWLIIKDPGRNLLGGFLKRWEEKSTLSRAFIEESKKLIADGFDAIIELESGKRKPGKN